jgi:hypothetical protein
MMKSVVLVTGLLLLNWAAGAQPGPAVISTPPNLPAGFAGASYSETLIGEPTSPTWSLIAGALPAGLSLAPSGAISGVPTTAGTSMFAVSFVGSMLPSSQTFTLTILAGAPRLAITPATLPSGSPSAYYKQNLAVCGGVPPYTWSLTSGALPGGMSLLTPTLTGAIPTATIWIEGFPTAAAVTSTFTVKVTDSTSATASQTFTLAVTPLTVTTSSTLPPGAVGAPYSQTLAATGGAPPYSWSLTLGALPPGFALSPAGMISGLPTTAGGAAFMATVTDANLATASQTFTLSIAPFTITTSYFLPAGVVGVPYSQTLSVNGGSPPYAWSVSSGSLPAGLTLSNGGLLSGVPSTSGTSTFSVVVTDARAFTASQSFSLIINLAPLAITTVRSLPSGLAGNAYSQTLAATGGVPPYQWQIGSGALPPLLSLSSAGVIAGVPTTPGVWTFSIGVTDAALHTASQAFSLTITLGPLAIGTPATLPAGVVGASYSQTLAATGGLPPYTWQVQSGVWPPGLIFSSGGALSGTPSQAGSFSFTVQVTDANASSASRLLSLLVSAPGCASSLNYSGQTFSAAGGSGTVTVTAPSGCQWTASSQLSWIAITAGASGTGNGAVAFQVAANSGAARSGVISLAGIPFTVEESAASLAGLSTIGSIAQVASGGGWKSTITLINTGNATEDAVVSFFDDNGNPLALPVNYPQAPLAAPALASVIDRTVDPGAELLIETAGPLDQPTQAGWALVQANGSLTGYSLFRWGTAPHQQEAVAALESRTPGSFLLSFDQTGGYVLGIAVANAFSPAANVTATLYDDAGVPIGGTTLPLPAMGHTAFMLTDKFPAADGKRGTLLLTPPAGSQMISTIAFRANNEGSLATVLPLTK